jgi:hypothetical protein
MKKIKIFSIFYIKIIKLFNTISEKTALYIIIYLVLTIIAVIIRTNIITKNIGIPIQNGQRTHSQDQSITWHSFRTTNAIPNKAT